jgi:hypothetical protein
MRFVVWYFLVFLPLRLLGVRGGTHRGLFFFCPDRKTEEGERGNSAGVPTTNPPSWDRSPDDQSPVMVLARHVSEMFIVYNKANGETTQQEATGSE